MKQTEATDERTAIATDAYSQTLSRLLDNPAAVKTKGSLLNVVTLLRHTETWTVQTVRVEQGDTVFVQRINSEGGTRIVLPPMVTEAIARQRDAIVSMTRKRAARQAVETRAAKKRE